MQLFFVAIVVGTASVHALQTNVSPTNYALINGFFGPDTSYAMSSLTSVTYTPLGVCVPTSQYPAVGSAPAVGGIIYSADASNNLFASYFPTAACGTQSAQISAANLVTVGVIQSASQANAANDVQVNVAPFTNVGTAGFNVPFGLAVPGNPLDGQLYKPVVGFSATVPTVAGVARVYTFSTTCASAPYATTLVVYNARVDTFTDIKVNSIQGLFTGGKVGQLACMSVACHPGIPYPWTGALNQAVATTCTPAAANNGGPGVTTLITSGFVESAQYMTYPSNTDLSKGVMNSLTTPGNNVPFQVNEFPIQATPVCSAYGAGLPVNHDSMLGQETTTTTMVQGTQTVAYSITQTENINGVPSVITRTYAAMIVYSTSTCTGTPMGLMTYLSDFTTTVVATGAVTKNVVAGSNVRVGVWYSTSKFVSNLDATVPYTIQNYYGSQAGCTSGNPTALGWTQYQFPAFGYNAFTQCAAPAATMTYSTVATPLGPFMQPFANPQLSYGVTCGQISNPTQYGMIQLYTSSACTGTPVSTVAYQLNACIGVGITATTNTPFYLRIIQAAPATPTTSATYSFIVYSDPACNVVSYTGSPIILMNGQSSTTPGAGTATCQLVTGTPASGSVNRNYYATNLGVYATPTTVGVPFAPSAWIGTMYAAAFGNQYTSGASVLGLYMTVSTVGSAAAPIGTTTPATAGTVSGVQAYIVGYTSQAACTAAMAAVPPSPKTPSTAANAAAVGTGAAALMGGYATCQQFTAWTQGATTTSTTTGVVSPLTAAAPVQMLTNNWVSTLVNGCSTGIAPTLSPTVGPAAPSAIPTAAPTGSATATTTSVSTALSASGATVTASLAASYPGISVANAVTTVTGTGVSATQNIPTGVTVTQAQTPAFQTAFIAAVATAASVSTSSVTGYTATQGRRLLAGVNVAYTITVPGVPVSSPTSSPACFAGTEQVTLENGATKAMADVAVGDRILTVNAKGEQVYSDVAYLPHGKNTDKAVFTVLATETGRDVKMTANHMLPAGACDVATASLPVVAASAVSVGACVETVSGRERVVSVSTVVGEGIYTAIAMEELLVVNGIVATPYGGVNPALANVYYNLHRLAYSVAGKAALAVQGATEGVWAALAVLAASR